MMGTVFRYIVVGIFIALGQTVNAVLYPGDTPIYPIPTTCPPAYDQNSVVVHLAHPSDCTKFYRCVNHGQKVLEQCPDGLHFSPSLQVCDWPQNAGCTASGPPVTTLTPTKPPTTTPPPPPTTTNPPTQKPITIAPAPPTPDSGCPFPDPLTYSVYFPHKDCTKFYECSNGKKIELDCPAGLHFNPVLDVCDWPYKAGCNGSTPPPNPPTPSTKAPPAPTKAPPTPTKAPPAPTPIYPIPTTCPPEYYQDSVVVHLAHPSDCTKYYRCVNHGQKVLEQCPDGLHFNPSLQICDWPHDAGCTASGPPVTTPPPPTTTNPPTKEPITIAPAPPSPDPGCPFPDPLTYSVYFPHKDCTKFYECSNGKKIELDCPAGLHFNPVLDVCDWPYKAGCNGSTPPANPPTPPPAPPTPPPAPPAPTPSGGCPFPDPLTYTVHLPHETDCTKFYKCDNGKKVEFDCPDDLHFNPVLWVCDWPYSAGC